MLIEQLSYDLEGYIYVLKNEIVNGIFKIGSTGNVRQRLSQLNNMLWDDILQIENLYIADYELGFPAYRSVNSFETQVHELFLRKRLKGEWFELDNSDLQQIRAHLTEKGFREISLSNKYIRYNKYIRPKTLV